jgi:hypothetical protein
MGREDGVDEDVVDVLFGIGAVVWIARERSTRSRSLPADALTRRLVTRMSPGLTSRAGFGAVPGLDSVKSYTAVTAEKTSGSR